MNISFAGKQHADAVCKTLYRNPANCIRKFKYKGYEGLEYDDLITDSFKKGVQRAKEEHNIIPGFDKIIDDAVDHIKAALKKV